MGGRGASYDYAKSILGQYNIGNITKNKNKIVDFFRESKARVEDGKIKINRETKEKADKLANELTNELYITDKSAQRDFKELKGFIAGKSFSMSSIDKSSIADFKNYDSKVKISGRATRSVDSLYKELAGDKKIGHYFPTSITSQADRLRQINKVYDRLKNSNTRQVLSKEDRAGMNASLSKYLIQASALRKRKRA